MTFIPAMWTVWGVLVLLLAVLKLYIGRLTRDEDDQVILDDSFSSVKDEQAAIVAKVNKIEPLLRLNLWLVGAMTVFVIGYYIRDILLNLHLIG
jgi:nucleoside recognition membrane protein YjiH